jgi:hypothetical protein
MANDPMLTDGVPTIATMLRREFVSSRFEPAGGKWPGSNWPLRISDALRRPNVGMKSGSKAWRTRPGRAPFRRKRSRLSGGSKPARNSFSLNCQLLPGHFPPAGSNREIDRVDLRITQHRRNRRHAVGKHQIVRPNDVKKPSGDRQNRSKSVH